MDRIKLLKKINEIAKVMTSKEAVSAIETLKSELEQLDNSNNKLEYSLSVDVNQLPLPLEIKNNSHRVALFTDGACRGNPGPGAWAYIVQRSTGDIIEKDAKHDKYTTNNKMELQAIISGLKSLLKYQEKSRSIFEIWVYTDSKYAVDGMKSWVAGWKKKGWKKADNKPPENLELWQELDKFNNNTSIVFNWIKGHAGHPQNEYVDQMANKVLDENGY